MNLTNASESNSGRLTSHTSPYSSMRWWFAITIKTTHQLHEKAEEEFEESVPGVEWSQEFGQEFPVSKEWRQQTVQFGRSLQHVHTHDDDDSEDDCT